MTYVSGRTSLCHCGGTTFDLVFEEWLAQYGCFWGQERCASCGAIWGFTRREGAEMAKSRKRSVSAKPKRTGLARKRTVKAEVRRAKAVGRTRKRAAVTDLEPAIEPSAPVDLGPIVLPEADEARKVLGRLAELNDRAIDLHKAYLERQTAAKKAKQAWDEAAEAVQEQLRLATHASGLPLFTEEEDRERDQERMEWAGQGDELADEANAAGF